MPKEFWAYWRLASMGGSYHPPSMRGGGCQTDPMARTQWLPNMYIWQPHDGHQALRSTVATKPAKRYARSLCRTSGVRHLSKYLTYLRLVSIFLLLKLVFRPVNKHMKSVLCFEKCFQKQKLKIIFCGDHV